MRKSFLSDSLILGVFFLLCVLLFWPTIFKPFLSDDYEVIYRVVIQKQLLLKGFFRPLSDLSIYLCSLIGGLYAPVYNVFNLLVHAASCFVLYKLCLVSELFPPAKRKFIAWTASFLFLIYPFHVESVVWVVGRASSLSNFFGFLSLLTAFSRIRAPWRTFLVCLFYFIGLASYETIFPLPLIILILLYEPTRPLRSYLPLAAAMASTLVLHIIVRVSLADTFAGQYGQKIFTPSVGGYLVNAFKVTGRLFLPPSGHSALLSVLFVFIAGGLIYTSYRVLRSARDCRLLFGKLILAVLVSAIIPFMFGLSTHTSEGDRIVYFTSFFLMLWLAFLISLVKDRFVRLTVIAGLSIYFLVFLFIGNMHWQTAGKLTKQLLGEIGQIRKHYSSVGLLDIPDEYKGAFVFRVGFQQALLLNHIDTAGVAILRVMTSEEASQVHETLSPQKKTNGFFLQPNTDLTDSLITVVEPVTFDTVRYSRSSFEKLFYWNKAKLLPVQ
ncbi:hypothetical protein [Flavisolibacter nicotianae]|uniref:hypothetical protein n=1 Tax=Flavisolibacter nicotianae TaxID=2364882 RepID=UPI000EAF51D5|nr:hypothetical protein [Flavisolibacter nicotianae]